MSSRRAYLLLTGLDDGQLHRRGVRTNAALPILLLVLSLGAGASLVLLATRVYMCVCMTFCPHVRLCLSRSPLFSVPLFSPSLSSISLFCLSFSPSLSFSLPPFLFSERCRNNRADVCARSHSHSQNLWIVARSCSVSALRCLFSHTLCLSVSISLSQGSWTDVAIIAMGVGGDGIQRHVQGCVCMCVHVCACVCMLRGAVPGGDGLGLKLWL